MLMKKEVIEDNEKLKEEIKDLKKQLEEEKKAYINMYNRYVEKNNIINECAEDILKELEENHHLSYGVALAIRQKLLDYKELKGEDKE